MLITSMGIFGFLSKAHIDSTMDASSNMVEIKTLNQQESMTKERLNYLLARAKDPSTASNRLDKQIQDTQKELAEINKKKLPLLKESNKLVAEVGPIKYVGDMIYGNDENAIDKAVRLVIMLIMVVFDPLAVLLLISANISLKESNEQIPNVGPNIDTETPEEKSVPEKEQDEDKVRIDKDNLTTIEKIQDQAFEAYEIETVSVGPGRHEERLVKKLQPKYDYEAEYAFREKENK
jgi:hypothetical protein